MTEANLSDYNELRALELIDLQAIKERRTVDASTLIDCVRYDVSNHKAIVLAVVLKYIPQNPKLTLGDLNYLRSIFKQGILETIDSAPNVSLSYVRAIELLHGEIRARSAANQE